MSDNKKALREQIKARHDRDLAEVKKRFLAEMAYQKPLKEPGIPPTVSSNVVMLTVTK